MISGGVSKFAKSRPDATFQKIVKESFDYAVNDVPKLKRSMIDGSVVSYFSDHFSRQLMAGIMATTTWVFARSRTSGSRAAAPPAVSVSRRDGKRSPRVA